MLSIGRQATTWVAPTIHSFGARQKTMTTPKTVLTGRGPGETATVQTSFWQRLTAAILSCATLTVHPESALCAR
jgi:hypothetical protein